MAIANPTLGVVARDQSASEGPDPDRWSSGAFGQLRIGGGTAFTSAQHPSSEVVDGTGVTLSRQYRVAGVLAAGTLQPEDAGDYLIVVDYSDVSCGAISGNIQFTVEYAPDAVTFAAFDATDAGGGGRMQIIKIATTVKHSFHIEGRQRLNKGSLVRVIVTSAAGDIVTITEGTFSITKIADTDPVSL